MKNTTATKEAKELYAALKKKGIKCILEYYDGKKHVDICIPEAKIYIEVEGLQHFTNPRQIIADLKRDYYSGRENIFTFRVTNQLIQTHLEEIADAIAEVIKKA